MDIQKHLLNFRYHILGALLLFVAILTLVFLAPRFLTVLAYFWPLFLSTALFLAVVFFFVRDSPSLPTDDSILKPAEELLNYVAAGHHLPEPPLDNHNNAAD